MQPAARFRASLPPVCLTLVSFAIAAMPTTSHADWSHWRGDGNGVAVDADPPLQLDSTSLAWRAAVPGRGSSSPVVRGDRVFVSTAVPTTKQFGELDFCVLCFDRNDGSLLWQRTVVTAVPHEPTHSTNTFASASPCVDDEHVYAFFGSRGLFALTLDGEPVWNRQFGTMNIRNGFGEGASPVLAADPTIGDVILVPWDHEGPSHLYALRRDSGEPVWQADRDEPSNWGTPLVIETATGKQVVTTGENKVRSYDLASGRELWSCGGQTQRPAASPVAGDGLVFVGSGFRGSFLAAFRPDGKGDIEDTDRVVWSIHADTPDIASLLLSDNRLYFYKAKSGILSCVDAATGQPHYRTVRVPDCNRSMPPRSRPGDTCI